MSLNLATMLRESARAHPGKPVALQLPNIPQFLIAYFDMLKAGCVGVPRSRRRTDSRSSRRSSPKRRRSSTPIRATPP